MRTLLVDDELHNCELIENLLQYHLPSEVEVVGYAHSVDQAAEIIRSTKVDLVFLDIQMPNKNGFELLSMFDSPGFELIFITSFDHYALPAIQADAIAYLLKPVDVEELKRAVSKAAKMHLLKRMTTQSLAAFAQKQASKIAVHEGDKVIYLDPMDIVSLQADGRYTEIVLHSGQKYMIAKNIKMIEDLLTADSCFMRINRSVILNISHVCEYSKSEPFTVMLKNETFFEVSRRKRKEILTVLKSGKK